MNVLVIGAGGKTGCAAVAKALAEGHRVTAFVHHANGFEIANVKVVEGDATDAGIMKTAMAKQDAVIYAMGGKVPYKKTTVETDAMRNIVSAMGHSGVKRIIAVTMLGLGKSGEHASLFSKLFYSTFLSGAKLDKTGAEAALTSSKLNWTIVRPPRLTDENAIGNVKVFKRKTDGNAHRISRKDVAAFMVDQLASDRYSRQAVTIATS